MNAAKAVSRMRLRTTVGSPLCWRRFQIDAVAITLSLDGRVVPKNAGPAVRDRKQFFPGLTERGFCIHDFKAVPGGAVGVESVSNFRVSFLPRAIRTRHSALIYEERLVVRTDVGGLVVDIAVGVGGGFIL